jgi:hypothetical protein
MDLEFKLKVKISLGDNLQDPAPSDPLDDRMRRSARDAVVNALQAAAQNGFSHDMAEISCVEVVSVDDITPPRKATAESLGLEIGDRVAFAKTSSKGNGGISVKRIEGVITKLSNPSGVRVQIKYGRYHTWEYADQVILVKKVSPK